MRVPLFVLALATMPLAVGMAQGNSGGNASPNADARCKDPSADTRSAQARASRVTTASEPTNQKNCPDPTPPPPPAPPTGPHRAMGMVYEDIDGSGTRDPFAGESGLGGWTVQLFTSLNQFVASAATDGLGNYSFSGLGNTTYYLCLVPQGGFVQTGPVNGTGCNGTGYSFTLTGSLETWVMNQDFGVRPQ